MSWSLGGRSVLVTGRPECVGHSAAGVSWSLGGRSVLVTGRPECVGHPAAGVCWSLGGQSVLVTGRLELVPEGLQQVCKSPTSQCFVIEKRTFACLYRIFMYLSVLILSVFLKWGRFLSKLLFFGYLVFVIR